MTLAIDTTIIAGRLNAAYSLEDADLAAAIGLIGRTELRQAFHADAVALIGVHPLGKLLHAAGLQELVGQRATIPKYIQQNFPDKEAWRLENLYEEMHGPGAATVDDETKPNAPAKTNALSAPTPPRPSQQLQPMIPAWSKPWLR